MWLKIKCKIGVSKLKNKNGNVSILNSKIAKSSSEFWIDICEIRISKVQDLGLDFKCAESNRENANIESNFPILELYINIFWTKFFNLKTPIF